MKWTKVHINAMDRQSIIREIERYSSQTALSPATITVRAVGNSRLYDRLTSGGDCTTRIAAKLIAYMEQNPPTKTEGAA